MNETKEVYFWKYCENCKYYTTDDSEDPCDLCLGNPMNLDSHKPVYFEEKGK